MLGNVDQVQNVSMNPYNGQDIAVTSDGTGNSPWKHFSNLSIVNEVTPKSDSISSDDEVAELSPSFEQRKELQSIKVSGSQKSAQQENIQDQLSLIPGASNSRRILNPLCCCRVFAGNYCPGAEIKRKILSIFYDLTGKKKKEIECGVGGNSKVYCLPEYPKFIIKNKAPEGYLPLTSDLRRFVENNQYQHLHLPDMTRLDDDHLLEERLPVPANDHELVMGYITHSEDFSPAVEEIADMFCKGAVIGDLQPGAKGYCYPESMRYDNLPPLIYSNEHGGKEYKIGLIDVDHLTIHSDPELSTIFDGIMDLAKIYPLHTSKIIAVVEKHFTLDEYQKESLTKAAEIEKKRIDAYFVKYDEFLKKREDNLSSELKKLNLTPEHDNEVKRKGDIYHKAMSLIVENLNKMIGFRNDKVRKGESFRNLIGYRSFWLNNPLCDLFEEIEDEIDMRNKEQGVSLDFLDQLRVCYEFQRSLVVEAVGYLHDRGYIYLNHAITNESNPALYEFMI